MDWSLLEAAADIIGTEKDDVRTFLTVCNSAFRDPLTPLETYKIREHPTDRDTFYVILRYCREWQGTLDELIELRDFNRLRIKQIKIIHKEDPKNCWIHVEWSKKAVVSVAKKNAKRKIAHDDE